MLRPSGFHRPAQHDSNEPRASALVDSESLSLSKGAMMLENLFASLTRAVEGGSLIALAAAFFWGILSILLSPCHLASIPLIVGFIDQQGRMTTRRASIANVEMRTCPPGHTESFSTLTYLRRSAGSVRKWNTARSCHRSNPPFGRVTSVMSPWTHVTFSPRGPSRFLEQSSAAADMSRTVILENPLPRSASTSVEAPPPTSITRASQPKPMRPIRSRDTRGLDWCQLT